MKIFQVDAFTDQAFSGNPACVCIMDAQKDEKWMLKVAKEMNVSETAFLLPLEQGYILRWFTPRVEVKLCGHATLASAHILWERGYVPKDETILFKTKSGWLKANLKGTWIELDFPIKPLTKVEASTDLIEALGDITVKYIGKSDSDYLVEVDSEESLRSITPDFQRLLKTDARGVIVTSLSKSSSYDFVSRFFAPTVGVNEDPVTGSAHCSLVTYWQERLKKQTFLAYQASERGGVIKLHLKNDRVLLLGQAVTVLVGTIL